MQIDLGNGLTFDDSDIEERFVRASGPGGQNVNKVATAVELRLDLSRLSWPPDALARLRALAGSRVTTTGLLVIDAREHRTQAQNRESARERLIDLLRRAGRRPRVRRPTRPSKAAKERRLESKRRQSARKRQRGAGDDEG